MLLHKMHKMENSSITYIYTQNYRKARIGDKKKISLNLEYGVVKFVFILSVASDIFVVITQKCVDGVGLIRLNNYVLLPERQGIMIGVLESRERPE